LKEEEMIETLISQITNIKTIKKVFMNKRDIQVYDDSWHNVSDSHTEYDISIITSLVNPFEWQRLIALEKEFDNMFPQFRFSYHLIESDPSISLRNGDRSGKLIYDAETKRSFCRVGNNC
jgi:hypothetical protein